MEVAHTVGPCTFSFCCRRAPTTTSELLWKAISLVGQKILKRLFILNVAALKGSGLVAVQAINLVVVGSICTTAKAQRPTYKQEKRNRAASPERHKGTMHTRSVGSQRITYYTGSLAYVNFTTAKKSLSKA